MFRDSRWVWGFFLIYLGFLITFAFVGDRGLVHSYHLWQARSELQKKIRQTEQEVLGLQRDVLQYRQSDRALEKIAREHYNMSRVNERVYIFRPENP